LPKSKTAVVGLALLCGAAALACGGSQTRDSGATADAPSADAPPGDAPPTDAAAEVGGLALGTVKGVPFVARDIAAQVTGPTQFGAGLIMVRLVQGAPSACDDLAGRDHPNTRVLRIYLYNATGPGTYTKPGMFYFHDFGDVTDGACTDDGAEGPGTVTLTDVSATAVSGTFDVTLQVLGTAPDSGVGVGHLTGAFVAPICPNVDAGSVACF
jgi:hypothetical protein